MWAVPSIIEKISLYLILLSSSNRKYQPFPLMLYFKWLCDWDGCSIICCRFHIYPGKARFCGFLLLRSLMRCANNWVHYDTMVVFVCLHIILPHYHKYAELSEGIELLKCLSGTFCLECVFNIKSGSCLDTPSCPNSKPFLPCIIMMMHITPGTVEILTAYSNE